MGSVDGRKPGQRDGERADSREELQWMERVVGSRRGAKTQRGREGRRRSVGRMDVYALGGAVWRGGEEDGSEFGGADAAVDE